MEQFSFDDSSALGRNLGPWVGPRAQSLGKVRRYSGKEECEISRENIQYLKEVGRKAGEALQQELEKEEEKKNELSQ